MESRKWSQPDGGPLVSLPFELAITGKGGRRYASQTDDFTWPPKKPVEIMELLKLFQTAHLFVFLLSTDSRISEALSLKHGCLSMTENASEPALAKGKTYKLSFSNDGHARDWPLPRLAAFALEQQETLSKILKDLGSLYSEKPLDPIAPSDDLWVAV